MKSRFILFVVLLCTMHICCNKSNSSSAALPPLDCQVHNYTILQVDFGNAAVPHYFTVQQLNGSNLIGPVYKRNLAAGELSDTVKLYSLTPSTLSSWVVLLVATDDRGIIWNSVSMPVTLKQCDFNPVGATF